MNKLLQPIVQESVDGIVDFIEALVTHNGSIYIEKLYKVVESSGGTRLTNANIRDKQTDYAITFGGEIPNSFSPLYEAAYFFQSLFLSAVGTLVIQNNMLEIYQNYIDVNRLKRRIHRDILDFSEKELWKALNRPIIPIVSSLDTDIEPYRYVKHQLWRINENVLHKRCSEITNEDLGHGRLDERLKDIYWIEDDFDIANQSIKSGDTLKEAKSIQYYLTLKILLNALDIDINNIPLFFNFSPREELIELGDESDILKVLLEMHEPESLKIYAKIIKSHQPWIFTFACPRCKESSKRVINTRLKQQGKVVRMLCAQTTKVFRNEYGTTVSRSGCGFAYEMRIPDTAHQLYELLHDHSFSVNYAARSLIEVVKTTFLSPIVMPVTQLGIAKARNGSLYIPTALPQGFGDHKELLTSVLATQSSFLNGQLARQASRDLKHRGLLTSREMLILGHTFPGRLHDRELSVPDVGGTLYITDTSVLKALKTTAVEEILRLSIHLNTFRLTSLMALKG